MGFRSLTKLGDRYCELVLAIGFALLASIPPAFAGSCKLATMVEFPITMVNLRPLVTAKINDTDVRFLVDSGAFYSVLSPASSAELQLPTHPAPFGFYITGIGGGRASASIAIAKSSTPAGLPLHNIEFLVGGSDIGTGTVGVLGQNVLHVADVEYDLGQGHIRLMKPYDCGKAVLAYWIGASGDYSVMNIESTTPQKPFTAGTAYVNGREIRVLFDSGAGASMLSLKAAARVGITPDSPGVVYAGATWGFGKNTIPSYIAPFSSFKIGQEEIRNTRLRIADIELFDADMLIGPDFFLSHRMYVASSQHKLYFTYNGGPVFNLAGAKYPSPGTPTDGSTVAAQPPSASSEDTPAAEKTPTDGPDAADYSRRGTALAARRDFQQALTNLTRACELAPDNADYFYQRGMIYWQLRQSTAAMADFDQAIKLRPADVTALISRAELSLQAGDKPHAGADLDAADAVAPKQADARYQMAHAYERADLSNSAIAQYDLWITWHADDARIPEALNSRCWMRALVDGDLPLALKDCNAALKRVAKSSPLYARAARSLGLVLLRMGEYDKSISDYDAALKGDPKDAWSWYGRGIDKLRKQKTSEGEADIAQATALSSKIADEYHRYGIAP
jgi:tetratricopeptide (TPR) repeat protein/predicted aspartyl protease